MNLSFLSNKKSNNYLNCITKLYLESYTICSPEKVLIHLLETYLEKKDNFFSTRNHHMMAAGSVIIIKHLSAQQRSSKSIITAFARELDKIPSIRIDRNGDFAHLLHIFFSLYPEYIPLVEEPYLKLITPLPYLVDLKKDIDSLFKDIDSYRTKKILREFSYSINDDLKQYAIEKTYSNIQSIQNQIEAKKEMNNII